MSCSTDPDDILYSSIKMDLLESDIELDQEFHVAIKVENIEIPLFGINLMIEYNNSMLSFVDSTGYLSGDFFSNNKISFIEENNGVIDLTITNIQGDNESIGSGSLGILIFAAKSPGYSNIDIIETELDFYNADGVPIYLEDLVIEDLIIIIE